MSFLLEKLNKNRLTNEPIKITVAQCINRFNFIFTSNLTSKECGPDLAKAIFDQLPAVYLLLCLYNEANNYSRDTHFEARIFIAELLKAYDSKITLPKPIISENIKLVKQDTGGYIAD